MAIFHSMPRFPVAAALAAVLCGCGSLDTGVEAPPYEEELPANPGTVYRVVPSLIQYNYTDTRPATEETLRWLSSQGFLGYNCIALTPLSPADSVGTFVFVARDANRGLLERVRHTIADTVAGYFVANGQGSRGTYVRDSQGLVTLHWNNGLAARYFDPSATIRIAGDSLIASATIREQADSILSTWNVTWTEQPCVP
jgi:hypothetical protein